MPQLIERDNVIAYLNAQIEKVQQGWLHDYGFPTSVIASLTDVKNLVRNLPTIEAEPVRHGAWHECWYTDTVCASICTNCVKAATQARHIVGQELMNNVRYPLCPNCGARMDGGADNG